MRDAPPPVATVPPPQPQDPLALQALALRYAAADLPPADAAAFEARLATDQAAREALAEAVRLSAAALGRAPPTPDRTFRDMIRERLSGRWLPRWLSRRAYRGHPLAWAALGAAVVGVTAVATVHLAARPADRQAGVRPPDPSDLAKAPAPVPQPAADVAPAPRPADSAPAG